MLESKWLRAAVQTAHAILISAKMSQCFSLGRCKQNKQTRHNKHNKQNKQVYSDLLVVCRKVLATVQVCTQHCALNSLYSNSQNASQPTKGSRYHSQKAEHINSMLISSSAHHSQSTCPSQRCLRARFFSGTALLRHSIGIILNTAAS